MTLKDFLLGGGGLLVLLSLIEISPIKVNPWSWLAKSFGRAINADVLKELDEMKRVQRETQKKLDAHIRIDDERNADAHRARILQFNNELIGERKHTREDFIEILAVIDAYEDYCREHEAYRNNRCVHAVANINRVYDERLEKHDFA